MHKSTEQIINLHINKHLIRERDLTLLFSGSAARRYALINKALKKGELIRICRGFYIVLDTLYNVNKQSQF